LAENPNIICNQTKYVSAKLTLKTQKISYLEAHLILMLRTLRHSGQSCFKNAMKHNGIVMVKALHLYKHVPKAI